MGLTVADVRQLCDNEVAEALFETLHDRKKFGLYFMKRPERRAPCLGRVSEEEEAVYGKAGMRSGSRLDLARAHVREAVACQEEALRQHGFCRKFSTHDYLHKLLEFYHERFELRLVVLEKAFSLDLICVFYLRSLEKLAVLEKEKSSDFDDEMFDLLPINCKNIFFQTLSPIVVICYQLT